MPKFVLYTENYGKSWNRTSFSSFYNLICRPKENRPSFWIYNTEKNTLSSWNYLQDNQKYNNYNKFSNQKISLLNFKLLLTKFIVKLRLYFYEKRVSQDLRTSQVFNL